MIDRFEGDKAVLIFKDKQKLVIDKTELADNLKEGDHLHVDLSDRPEVRESHEEYAKSILREILNR